MQGKLLPAERMGLSEVAKELGVEASNVQHVPGLPAPVQKLSRGQLWVADEIRAFAAARRQRLKRVA